MTYKHTVKIPNGEIISFEECYSCDHCNQEVWDSHPHHCETVDEHYCWDCSFILGFIKEKDYLKCCPINLENIRAGVFEGRVVLWTSKVPPWEKKDQDIRKTKAYKEWRLNVFTRDNYKCQECGQVGGELNAHHIKHFSTHKKLRFDLNNGITLCVECHRKVHRRKEG